LPTFCRHNRFIQNCPICSKDESDPVARAAAPRPRTAPRSSGSGSGSGRSSRRSSPSSAGGLRVRHTARAADDGYRSDLAPGLKASADAERLADEIAFSAARLAELASDPPGVYAEIASAGDVEEASWLAFLVAYVSPASEPSVPTSSWASGELPDLSAGDLGPRTAHDPSRGDRTLVAYRAWAARAGSQSAALTGDAVWTPERRFERVFERLSLPGFHRIARLDLLTLLGRLGVYEMRAGNLHFGVGNDESELAAKRVFGIGERTVLESRAAELADAAQVPLESLDLALFNFGKPDTRATLGSAATPDDATRDRIRGALGVGATADV
jgi:hypothetical protein